jgi:nitrite reductase/ring-hydroxylating ferredoxin subunit
MSVAYRAVQWNRHKRFYDMLVAAIAVGWVAAFIALSVATMPAGEEVSELILAIRAFGTGAIALLVVILSIGPLARLSPRLAPVLYNRRHLGVTMFLMAFAHGALATLWYHGFGVLDPFASILASGWPFDGLSQLPFQPLGLAALLILFAMAATSHDFWLRNLSPRAWKSLHQLVFLAFALLVAHVGFGVLQDAVSPVYGWAAGALVAWVVGLHVAVGFVERARDRAVARAEADGWVRVCAIDEIDDGAARRVRVADPADGRARTVAVFRSGDAYSAISGVCAHQGGPLAEGRIVDGCVTCPWHGYQYLADCGQSPPPFTERIPTYELRIEGRTILVHPQAKAPGTPVPPCRSRAGGGA